MFTARHLKDAYNGSTVGWNNMWLNTVNNNYIPVQFLLNAVPIERNDFTEYQKHEWERQAHLDRWIHFWRLKVSKQNLCFEHAENYEGGGGGRSKIF